LDPDTSWKSASQDFSEILEAAKRGEFEVLFLHQADTMSLSKQDLTQLIELLDTLGS